MNRLLKITCCSLLLIILMTPISAVLGQEEKSNQQTYFEKLDRLSHEAVSLTEKGDFEQAKLRIEELSRLFSEINEQKDISSEAVEIAANTIVMGERTFNRVSPDKNQLIWHAFQIQILIDAITHDNQPIWKNYHLAYIEQLSKMIHLSSRKQQRDLTLALNENTKLYNILKPIFAITQTTQIIEAMDSNYNLLLQQTRDQTQNWDTVSSSLEELRQSIDQIFLGKDEYTLGWYISSNSPFAMIAIMTSILFTALSYVGWRMYKGQTPITH